MTVGSAIPVADPATYDTPSGRAIVRGASDCAVMLGLLTVALTSVSPPEATEAGSTVRVVGREMRPMGEKLVRSE